MAILFFGYFDYSRNSGCYVSDASSGYWRRCLPTCCSIDFSSRPRALDYCYYPDYTRSDLDSG